MLSKIDADIDFEKGRARGCLRQTASRQAVAKEGAKGEANLPLGGRRVGTIPRFGNEKHSKRAGTEE